MGVKPTNKPTDKANTHLHTATHTQTRTLAHKVSPTKGQVARKAAKFSPTGSQPKSNNS